MNPFKLKAFAAAITLSFGGLASAAPIGTEGLFFSASNGNSGSPSSIVINLLETTVEFRANAGSDRSLSGPSLDILTEWLGLQTVRPVVLGDDGAACFHPGEESRQGGLLVGPLVEGAHADDDGIETGKFFRGQIH